MKNFKPEDELVKKVYQTEEINFHVGFTETKTILGLDIYRYSDYKSGIQEYVPVLFRLLYKTAISSCIKNEPFVFQKYGTTYGDFESNFINTGDGGFQIFDNPLQALVFAAYFQAGVIRSNSNTFNKEIYINLSRKIGRIELRYAISTGGIFSYNKNFYGEAIINNARMLSKDNLNRFLSDYASIDWFNKTINTIENLMIIKLSELRLLAYFKDYNFSKDSRLIVDFGEPVFKTLETQKIGIIKSKNTSIEIHNLRVQLKLIPSGILGDIKTKYRDIIVTLGNSNVQGIE
jgi:hypothetical protein